MAVGRNETSSAKWTSATVVSGLVRIIEPPPNAEGRARLSSARRPWTWLLHRRAENSARRDALPAWWPVTRSSGASTTTHGRSNGRLLALAPVNSAAASNECHTSARRREVQARQAKSKAASTEAVGNET